MARYTLHFHRTEEATVEAEAASLDDLEYMVRSGKLDPSESDWDGPCICYCDVHDEYDTAEVASFELDY